MNLKTKYRFLNFVLFYFTWDYNQKSQTTVVGSIRREIIMNKTETVSNRYEKRGKIVIEHMIA